VDCQVGYNDVDNESNRMTKYVALLRGIAPLNPNMRNEKLRGVFEELGFVQVKTVISSGNVLFGAETQDVPALERMIETALFEHLKFHSTTIIRSQQQLQELVEKHPFHGYTHSSSSYLTVTFLQRKPGSLDIPKWPENRAYKLVAAYDREICAVTDTTAAKTPDLMARLENWYGKDITTRTWKTVERILSAW
jgi:uncharacterized protein (DUF1697 family)